MNSTPPVDTADVLIVGAGPAGLMASLCLHTFGLSVIHVDNRPRPTEAGKADGIQPRTVEVLRNIGPWVPPRIPPSPQLPPDRQPSGKSTMGIYQRLLMQSSTLFEATFWDPTPEKALARTSRVRTCPDFIDIRDRYALAVHQGITEQEFIREISARAPHSRILRPVEFLRCTNTPPDDGPSDYPIEAVVRTDRDGTEKLIRTKYLLGCDGARSAVRKSLGGAIRLEGEGTEQVWGVMDCWVESDFPDMRVQCMMHSRHNGSLMVIPRENDMVRFYVQLTGPDCEVARQTATLEDCQQQTAKIFHPYTLRFFDTHWFGLYGIGQRLANAYTLDGRIILGGDAAHTHSPKEGQGMNISMLDMFSLAWKINLVEKGLGKRDAIMATYEDERRWVAQQLLALDAEFSSLFCGHEAPEERAGKSLAADGLAVDPQQFMDVFKRNAYFVSGCGAVYRPNVLNAPADSAVFAGLPGGRSASCLRVGERLPPGDVLRALDGNPVELEHAVRMDGAFRIHIFLGATPVGSRLDHLARRRCFLHRFRAPGGRPCSIFNSPSSGPNPFFTLLLVSSRPRDQWDTTVLPPLFSGPYASQVFSDEKPNIVAHRGPAQTCSLHSKYGFKEGEDGGGIIIVRPDGYVGAVMSLCEPGWTAVERYFDGFLVESAA